jgi:hypothetical protein
MILSAPPWTLVPPLKRLEQAIMIEVRAALTTVTTFSAAAFNLL